MKFQLNSVSVYTIGVLLFCFLSGAVAQEPSRMSTAMELFKRVTLIRMLPSCHRSSEDSCQRSRERTRLLPMFMLCAAHCFGADLRAPSGNTTNSPPSTMQETGVCRLEIRTNVVGDFYYPSKAVRIPGLILLGGSDGEPMKERSALLASNGYAVLNLFYFGHDSLPKNLAEVPVEYLRNAVSWLATREQIDPNRVAVIGHSLGSEAAFLIGTLCPNVRAVVVVAPSSVVWPGRGASGYFHSAWSLNGKELPYVPVKFSKGVGAFLKEITGGTQIEHRPLFEDALKNKAAVEKARIPVEKINGAVLLISGKDDRVWPSESMAEAIVTSLRKHRHPFTYRHLSYEKAGHSFGLPSVPRKENSNDVFKMGGTSAGNAAAATESWRALLDFLERELRNGAVASPN